MRRNARRSRVAAAVSGRSAINLLIGRTHAAESFEDTGKHGGEEILVLDGTLSDESGDYPKGTYLRNPPGSHHAPFSREGCTLLVKLRQFAPDDTARIVLDTNRGAWQPGSTDAYD